MNLSEIAALLETPRVLIERVISEHKSDRRQDLAIEYTRKQYNLREHAVFNPGIRPDRTVYKEVPNGVDDLGNVKMTMTSELVRVNRTAIPLQRLLVSRASAFLTGGGVTLASSPKGAGQQAIYDAVKKVWADNKIAYRNATVAKHCLSEMECAEIWYSRADDKTAQLRCKIVAPSLGYELYPVFSDEDDLVAFGLRYKAGKRVRFDLYTAEKLYRFEHAREGGGWELNGEGSAELPYGKLPVIYYRISEPIWADVQVLIERLEKMLSNLGDSNDNHSSPVLAFIGDVKGLSPAGTTGRAVQLENGADVKYVSYDNAPESLRMEMERIIELIFTSTQVPNISFQEMKGLGDISGAAWDRMMIDAHLKAKDGHEGWFGEGIQRRVNFLKTAVVQLPGVNAKEADAEALEITPEFALFRINDESEWIDTAMRANGGKPVLGHRESIEFAGVSKDADATMNELIDAEESSQQPKPVAGLVNR